jgi:hypothetical protein
MKAIAIGITIIAAAVERGKHRKVIRR